MNTIHRITRTAGIAGQLQYTATVQYGDEDPRAVTFIGSQFGGPVLMRTTAGAGVTEVFVTNPNRFGGFSERWVRNFFEAAEVPA